MLWHRPKRGLCDHPENANSLTTANPPGLVESVYPVPVFHSMWIEQGPVDGIVDKVTIVHAGLPLGAWPELR